MAVNRPVDDAMRATKIAAQAKDASATEARGTDAAALLREAGLIARWRLGRIGLTIDPYYWSLEGCDSYSLDPLAEPERYRFGWCDINDPATDAAFPPDRMQHLSQCREGGWEVFCVREGAGNNAPIVAFMSLRFDTAPFLYTSRPLAAHEAYIIWIYTVPDARGRGIAAHLRDACYAEMRKRGVHRLYSYIDAMNAAGLGTARKVGLRPLELMLHIGLGRRRHWHLRLRRYQH